VLSPPEARAALTDWLEQIAAGNAVKEAAG